MLGGISLSHFLNDTMQSLIPSVYPILKDSYALDFAQIGLITLAFQFTASLLQPLVGHFTDKKAQPFSLADRHGVHVLRPAAAQRRAAIPRHPVAAALVGLGSAVFHPESARIARLASGGRYGFAQSVFQVGGSAGTVDGSAARGADRGAVRSAQHRLVFLDRISGDRHPVADRAMVQAADHDEKDGAASPPHPDAPSSRRVMIALAVLVALLFSKQLYVSSLSSYYIFYLIDKFGVSTQAAQLYLFIFLASNAVGAFFGGPLGDRFGRKYVIWFSILGALPFTLALPYAGLFASAVLTVFIGFIISSATSSIIVFAQELMPHRFGMISGVFFGFAFGIGGLGAAVLGKVADHTGIAFVYQVCAFLPAIGLLAVFLPKMPRTAH